MVKEINSAEANQIIDDRKPEGLFLHHESDGSWTAIDNETGDAFTENFRKKGEAELWLRNPDIFGVPVYKDGFAQLVVEVK